MANMQFISDDVEIQRKYIVEFYNDALSEIEVQYPELYKKYDGGDYNLYTYEKKEQSFETLTDLSKTEGKAVALVGYKYGNKKSWTTNEYGMGFMYSQTFKKFNQWNLVEGLTKYVAKKAKLDIDTQISSLLNNADNTTNTGYDGKALYSTSHTLVGSGGTVANTPASGTDLSLSSLETAENYFYLYKDSTGTYVQKKARKLVVHPSKRRYAYQLVNGTNVPFEMSNTQHWPVFKEMEVIPYVRQTTTNQWTLMLDKDDPDFGLFYVIDIEPNMEVVPQTDGSRNVLADSHWAYKFGIENPRCCYGSMGT